VGCLAFRIGLELCVIVVRELKFRFALITPIGDQVPRVSTLNVRW
jgi:hypothetical protein